MTTIRAQVKGVGHYLPERVIPNSWFEDKVDTTDEWIRSRSGIERRHFAAEGQPTSDLATRAAQAAHADEVRRAFLELMHSKGDAEPDEDVLGDGIAFAGVAKYPARIKCALLPWMALQDAEAKAGITVTVEGETR